MSVAPSARPEACALCGARTVPRLDLDGGFALVRCLSCSHVATSPVLSDAEVSAHYPPEYYGARNRRFNPLFEAMIRVFRSRRARMIERKVSTGRLLDVGCGRGLLPYMMRLRGWEAHGIELSENSAAHAREVLGVPVHVGSVEGSPFPPASFDAVVFWHVLEHIRDPRAAIRRAHDLLAPSGLLVVAVPNFESLQARVGGRGWFHLDVPRHYQHFGLKVLERLLAEEGFAVETVSHFALEQNPYGWIQSLLNRLGFRHNLLYEILKSRTARSVASPMREHPVQSALTAAALLGVVPLSILLWLVEVAARRGGTIDLYARRLPEVREGETPSAS